MAAKRKGFLAGYSVAEKYLLAPDRSAGRAGILQARNPEGRDVLVKFWPRTKSGLDVDLEDIWRSEVRQLQRLAAVPRADDLFVHMLGSGQDPDGFYLILDPENGSPLETLMQATRKPDALAGARTPRSRKMLWANCRRLVEALELLHSQGAIHRNLDPWAVVTGFSDQPDFRLTGFEWSMRIATVGGSKSSKTSAPRMENSFSFARDWRDLALLFALILDIPRGPLGDLSVVPSRVAEHVSAAEARLLRAMLGLENVDRLDGTYILGRVDDIVGTISAEAAGREARLCLSVRLGQASRLSAAVRKASGDEIEVADIDEQIRFILDDMGSQPQLVGISEGGLDRYAIVGSQLTYRLGRYRAPRALDEGNWEFASCDRADRDAPHSHLVKSYVSLDAGSLEILPDTDAHASFARRRSRVRRWDDIIARIVGTASVKTDNDRMHESFALLLVLEMAFAAADVFPVEVIGKKRRPNGEHWTVYLTSRQDSDRAKLSELLGLEAPAKRLANLLSSLDSRQEGAWAISEDGALGDRAATTTTWSFVDTADYEGLESFSFEGGEQPRTRAAAFLVPTEMVGRVAQFKRRIKALAALREHAELLRMLVDPRLRIDDSHDPIDQSAREFLDLDSSKRGALTEILSTIPMFLLQGPPGVGKTYLVGDIVRRRFVDEPGSRMLLSAQSNSAIDHLMGEIETSFGKSNAVGRPLMVRARAADDDDSAGAMEVDLQARRMLSELAKSPLGQASSQKLQQRLVTLAGYLAAETARQGMRPSGERKRLQSELRAIEGMILRAANLVFATTNSSAVERLIEERSLFDWSIVEEAGKATGGELLSPLLLSHRRLMIGDHKQLPPFDLDKMKTLLAATENVRSVVGLVDDLVSRYLKDPGLDETFSEINAAGEEFGRACADTIAILALFETFVERELTRQKRNSKGRPIARRLSEQYRMHPAIANLVSRCFYDGELKTSAKKEAAFRTGKAPFQSSDSGRLPDAPIVFIDMPYAQEEGPGGRGRDRSPPWSNPEEVEAVGHVLSQLQPSLNPDGSQPTLAVLSPYSRQVSALNTMISQRQDSHLSNLAGFRPAVGGTSYCGTVDSFQGGEADVVVVSLVRNNHHVTPTRALGFLMDNRRTNVLLSRAKWKLVLVGSLSFLRNVAERSKQLTGQDVAFLHDFLGALDDASAKADASIVPWATLRGGKK